MSLKETFSETDGIQGHYLLAGFDDDGDGGWCRWLDTSQYRFGRSISMWMGTLCASVLSAIHPLCAHVYARIERKATREATVEVGKKKIYIASIPDKQPAFIDAVHSRVRMTKQQRGSNNINNNEPKTSDGSTSIIKRSNRTGANKNSIKKILHGKHWCKSVTHHSPPHTHTQRIA